MNKTFGPLIIAAIASGVFAFFVVTYAITMPTRSQLAAVGSIQTKAPQDKSAVQKQFLFSEINSLNGDILNPTLANKASKNKASNLSADKTQTDKVLVQKAEQRKVLMKQLMKMDPRLFNALAIKKQARSTLPTSIQSKVEQNITITGKISTIHVDDFTNTKNSHYEYYIQTPQVKYYFYPTSDTPILSGTTVKVTGYAIDDQISANTGQDPPVIIQKIPTPMTDSVGNQRTLVLLVKGFVGDSEPFTPVQGRDLVFNSQFQNFMKEQSYGKVSFSGDVFGWMILNKSVSGGCYLADPDLVSRAVDTYNIDLNNYDRIVYLYTNTFNGCSFFGKSSFNVNGREYLVSQSSLGLDGYNLPSGWGNQSFTWTNLDYILSHELGHALGVAHANAWVCTDGQILYGDCSHYEYGNYYDTMGDMGYSLDYNAYFKEQLGWIPASQVLSITHSGSYTINPLELVNGVKLATVDILNTTITPFTIEFRKGIGFDSNLSSPDLTQNQNGIFVSHIQDDSLPATELLDMSPQPIDGSPTNPQGHLWQDNILQATLNLPSASSSVYSFIDAGRGITIGPVLNVSASSISFNVTLGTPVCLRSAPIIANLNYSYSVAAGGSGYVGMYIVNQDYYGCEGTSNFNIVPTSQSLWQYDIYPPEDIAIKPGESSYKNLNFIVPNNTLPGSHVLNVDVINKTSGLNKTVSVTIQVTEPLVITNINPVSGPIGTNVSITGIGFDPKGNQVSMNGTNGWTDSQTISSSDGKIIYTIPSIINTCNGKDCHGIPTPDGDYTINVWANNSSASTNFHVGTIPSIEPSATIIGPSTLVMTYDPYGGENMLRSTFNVAVSAGSQDQKITKSNAFWSEVSSTNGGNHTTGTQQYAEPSGTTDDGNGYYVIPAGTTPAFVVQTTVNPRIMFAGAYHGTMAGVTLGDYLNPTRLTIPSPNTTDPVTIIGELSPYIGSYSPNPVPANSTATLTGVRFATSTDNTITLQDINHARPPIQILSRSSNGTTLSFVVNAIPDNYNLQVNHPVKGLSNIIYFTVSTSTQPDITVSSPNGEETFTSDQSIPITWNMNYANTGTSIIVRLLQYGDGNVFDSKLIQGTSGDNQFTVPAGKVGPGRYMAEVADNPGYGGQNVYDDSNGYFTIVGSTIPQSSNNYLTPMQISTSSLGAAIWDMISQYLNYHY